jgi:tetratricopeptide (TPR) repeat protein
LKNSFQINADNNSSSDHRFYFYFGRAEEEEGNLQAAEVCYIKAIELNRSYARNSSSFNTLIYSGLYGAVLGILEYRLGNSPKAIALLKTSLNSFDKCPIPEISSVNKSVHPDGIVYSGQVFCLEHLAQINSKQGKLDLANSLQDRARKVRSQNPYWAASKNPNPDHFYSINGFFPYPIEIITSNFSIQKINSK